MSYLLLNSQKATAAAAATLRESTLCDMGIFTTWSAAVIVSFGNPSPSVPIIIARRGTVVSLGSAMEMESSVSAMAAVVKPNSFSCPIPPSSHVHGTRKTDPMDTLIARRLSGSHELRVNSTASIPSAAALRNMAPIFVVSTTPSMTTIRRASRQTSFSSGSFGRRIAHNTPRVRV